MIGYGHVMIDGIAVELLQQPYAASVDDEEVYLSRCVHADKEYRVTWIVTDPTCADFSDACDWDSYSLRILGDSF